LLNQGLVIGFYVLFYRSDHLSIDVNTVCWVFWLLAMAAACQPLWLVHLGAIDR
jgi:hypothetical protein